ncbi:hypothetical protein Hanom_Chr13g01212151 [Helianthus anomalus]
METGWILLPDKSPTLETFRKRPRRVPMVFPSPTSTRDGYGHINGVPVLPCPPPPKNLTPPNHPPQKKKKNCPVGVVG